MISPTPTVSACLLTYKRASVLPRTIGDILAQTYGDFELVINDDNSPDDTEPVCRSIEKRDPRIRYFRNSRNLRYAGNQNAAVARSRGKFVAFLHDGDRYSPRLLERWVRALEEHPSAALVFNAVDVLGPSGQVVGGFDHGLDPLTPGRSMYDEMLTRLASPIFGIVMARRSALLAAGPFDESMPVLADVDMWFRLLLSGDVAYEKERLYAIYPREEGHENKHVNWAIHGELARIYRLACDRRHPLRGREWRAARRLVDANLTLHELRSIGSCVRRLKWNKAANGIPVLLAGLGTAIAGQIPRNRPPCPQKWP